jgi:hypothetical protein
MASRWQFLEAATAYAYSWSFITRHVSLATLQQPRAQFYSTHVYHSTFSVHVIGKQAPHVFDPGAVKEAGGVACGKRLSVSSLAWSATCELL